MNESTNARTGIVLSFERLGALRLGPYGNTWNETPAINRLASQSLVFDRMIADSSDPQQVMRSVLTGVHSAGHGPSVDDSLMKQVGSDSGQSLFVSDDPEYCDSQLAGKFDRVVLLKSPESTRAAATAADTHLAFFFAQAIELIGQIQAGDFCWIHCRGLAGPWDAPFEYRQQFAGPEDPVPPRDIAPPVCGFDSDDDSPDTLLGFQMASAAQVRLIDELLEVFMEQMDAGSVTGQAMFGFLGLAGYPLGEHGQVGPTGSLYNESIHLPCLIRLPHQSNVLGRTFSLIQPSGLRRIWNDWVSSMSVDEMFASLNLLLPDWNHEVAIATGVDSQMIETHAWKLIRRAAGRELFVRPDDRWEVNDVLDRCTGIAAELEGVLDDQIEKIQSGKPGLEIELPAHLAIVDD